jgi:hypothetical protein
MNPQQRLDIETELRAFNSLQGDFFDALDNPEDLMHVTPLAALREILKVEPEAERSVRIDVWTRQVVPNAWKASVASRLVCTMLEDFDDEEGFGNLHDSTKLADADDAEVTAAARQLVELFLSKVKVWRCEKTAEVHLSRAAVNEIYVREGWHVTE